MVKPKIAILAVNNNLKTNIQERFIWSLKNSEKKIPFDIFLGGHSKSTEAFRKTTIINDILRKITGSYSFIIQTDIDMLIPPNLIKITMDNLRTNNHCYHVNFHYVESNEMDTWMAKGYGSIPWGEINNRPVFHASGSWNGMSRESWIRSNGFCEAIYYLGGPDTEFFRRSMQRGIVWMQENALPLSHINHPRRAIPKQGKKNLSIAKRYPLDYNWLYRRLREVCETTITKIGVNY